MAAVVGALGAAGQEPPPEPPPPAPTGAPEGRPGLWKLGPLYVTPTFHVGNIGLDTNVLFQSEDRERDVSFSGGPGLDLVVPASRALRFLASGELDYLYFLNTEDQRRLTGSALAGVRYDGASVLATARHAYDSPFRRPNPQVDDRIDQTTRETRGELGFWGGARRFGLSAAGSATRYDVDSGQTYLGTDLRATLARDEYLAQLALRY